MFRIRYALLIIACYCGQLYAQTQVMTSHPATFSIASTLTENTEITIVAAAPLKLPASRLYSYLTGRGQSKLVPMAEASDAVITIRSIWPEDPIYPHARRANIRIVPIDAGQPMDEALPGIAQMQPENDADLYAHFHLEPMPANGEQSAPWLSPTALGRMADILSQDLSTLTPDASNTINTHLSDIKHNLMVQKAKADQALANSESLVTLALGPQFGYLASDLGLELVGTLTASSREWNEERLSLLSSWIESEEVAVVLIDQDFATDAILAAITAGGAQVASLQSPNEKALNPIVWMQANLEALSKAYHTPK